MNVLVWHHHGSWMTAFVQGQHRYLVPVVEDRGPDGRGRARTWDWPSSVVEVRPGDLRHAEVDVVVVQRPRDLHLAERWTGRRLPVVWVEHDLPQGRVAEMVHPAADRPGVLVVHVTSTNALFWDCRGTPSTVIEHGIPDPGERYDGSEPRMAAAINEPLRRGRVVGSDLLPRLAAVAPIDLFGMGAQEWCDSHPGTRVRPHEDLPQHRMLDELPRRRAYVHPYRWTSLGLALLEAMHLGMPVVAVGTGEVPTVVPPGAGVVSNRPEELAAGMRMLVDDPDTARAMGREARAAVIERFALRRFLSDWDRVIERAATAARRVA